MLLLSLALFFPDRAEAFCGTYVSSYEDAPENATSEVAIVRQGTTTTLTVSNDVEGDTRDFAMVVPVPEVLAEEQINVVDPTVFDRLRDYSNPREVAYDCSNVESDADTDADTDSDTDGDTDTDVEIEAQYIVGEYDVLILSAAESNGLVAWLQTNGYNVPDTSADLLGEYIEGGAYFFAAQVREDAGIESGDVLSPLQFSYASEPFGLPIRIGTLNSPGLQDLRVYAVNNYSEGSVAIANYDEVEVDHDCMWQPEGGESLTEYYDRQLDEAFGNVDGAEWMTEYAWGNGNCDPCAGVPPSAEDIYTLGFRDDDDDGVYWFTRLRMRYAPEDVDQDLVLYETRVHELEQMRFIQYDERLEEHFPVCGVGMVDDPGSCDEDPVEPDDTGDPDETWIEEVFDGDDDGDDVAGCGCNAPARPSTWGLLVVAALFAVTKRRVRA